MRSNEIKIYNKIKNLQYDYPKCNGKLNKGYQRSIIIKRNR